MSELAKRVVAAIMKDMDRAAGFVPEDLSDFARSELEAVVDGALEPPTDEDDARRFLWMNHGCPPEALEGDAGEMQCNSENCHLDFKREPLDSLLIALLAQGRLTAGVVPGAVPVSNLRRLVERIRTSADASEHWANELAAVCDGAERKEPG
jgi:hypothetical protein